MKVQKKKIQQILHNFFIDNFIKDKTKINIYLHMMENMYVYSYSQYLNNNTHLHYHENVLDICVRRET